MAVTTITSREFNQDTSRAKKAAHDGPVFITDRGSPAHVLLSIEEYQRLMGGAASIIELLAMPNAEEIPFEAPRATGLMHPASRIANELLDTTDRSAGKV
jgi:prevent-host-death family protein